MPKLLDRLESKLQSQGVKEPYALAMSILYKNGYINMDGSLTDKGKVKENLPEGTKGLGNRKTLKQDIQDTLSRTYGKK